MLKQGCGFIRQYLEDLFYIHSILVMNHIAPAESEHDLWCWVTKYIYSSTVFKFNFEVLYLNISILCDFVHYNSEVNIVFWLYIYVHLVTLQI